MRSVTPVTCRSDVSCRPRPQLFLARSLHEIEHCADVILSRAIPRDAESQRERAAQSSGGHEHEARAVHPLVDALVQGIELRLFQVLRTKTKADDPELRGRQ